MNTISSNNPLPTARITILDEMRGIALFAIFLCNLLSFTEAHIGDKGTFSYFLYQLIHSLFGDSSRPLFSFMFGVSMLLIYDAAVKKGVRPYMLLLRRMLILLVFGAVHLFGIWAGDILFMYALDGLMLLLFVRIKPVWLMIIGSLLFVIMSSVMNEYGSSLFSYAWYMPDYWIMQGVGLLPQPDLVYTNEYIFSSLTEWGLAIQHLPFFLFGMVAYRKQIFTRIPLYPRRFWILGSILLLVGLLGKIGSNFEIIQAGSSIFYIGSSFFNFAVTVGAIFIIILLGSRQGRIATKLSYFAPVGRMAFSNYLMQSLVFVSIFTASGKTIFASLGWIGSINYTYVVLMAIVFFIIQMIVSHYWLKLFNYGPFEWLWRIGTNLQIPPFRKIKKS
ncbi:DUF418 domain-containing protein [Paenibacillus nicotianae]|uniref:DUF418 domain-containing protein n=1 Tax=Paenibacillus nicotianae TaxID=1526551 RepID=A0ABW4UR92_9BACL